LRLLRKAPARDIQSMMTTTRFLRPMPCVGLALGLCAALAPRPAQAHPRPLAMSYTSEVLPEGAGEVETFVHPNPVRPLAVPSGETVWYLHSQFQVEIEYGLGKNFELGLYLTFTPSPGEGYSQTVTTFPEGNGMKQRIRWAAADPGELPVDLNLYGEIVE